MTEFDPFADPFADILPAAPSSPVADSPAPETVIRQQPSAAALASTSGPPVICFDIETGPLPTAELFAAVAKFDESSLGPPPGEFDPSSVKYGNLKDETKRAEKLEAARAAHDKERAGWLGKVASSRGAWERQCEEQAPLSPVTGRVLAIGYGSVEAGIAIHDGDGLGEPQLLQRFWDEVIRAKEYGHKLAGWNILGFDVPFILRRSWRVGLRIPSFIDPQAPWKCGCFVDLLQVWQCGAKNSGPSIVNNKLDTVAKFLTEGNGKAEECTGGTFHKLWNGSKEERAKAVAYLTRDVELCVAMAVKMGVIR